MQILTNSTRLFYETLISEGSLLIPYQKLMKKPLYFKTTDITKGQFYSLKEYIKNPAIKTINDVIYFLNKGYNVGLDLSTTNILVLDFDTEVSTQFILEFIKMNPDFCPCVEKTPRGLHLYFRNNNKNLRTRLTKVFCMLNIEFDYLSKGNIILPNDDDRFWLTPEGKLNELNTPYDLLFLPHLARLRDDQFNFGPIYEGQRHSYIQFLIKAFIKNRKKTELGGFSIDQLSSNNFPLLRKLNQIFIPSYGIENLDKQIKSSTNWYKENTNYHDGGVFKEFDDASNFSTKGGMDGMDAKKTSSTPYLPGVDLHPTHNGEGGMNPTHNGEGGMNSTYDGENEISINSKKLQISFFCNEPIMQNLSEESNKIFLNNFLDNLGKSTIAKGKKIESYIFGFQKFQKRNALSYINPFDLLAEVTKEKNLELKAKKLDEFNNLVNNEPNDNDIIDIFTCFIQFEKRQKFFHKRIAIPCKIGNIRFDLSGNLYKVIDEKFIFQALHRRNCYLTNFENIDIYLNTFYILIRKLRLE